MRNQDDATKLTLLAAELAQTRKLLDQTVEERDEARDELAKLRELDDANHPEETDPAWPDACAQPCSGEHHAEHHKQHRFERLRTLAIAAERDRAVEELASYKKAVEATLKKNSATIVDVWRKISESVEQDLLPKYLMVEDPNGFGFAFRRRDSAKR